MPYSGYGTRMTSRAVYIGFASLCALAMMIGIIQSSGSNTPQKTTTAKVTAANKDTKVPASVAKTNDASADSAAADDPSAIRAANEEKVDDAQQTVLTIVSAMESCKEQSADSTYLSCTPEQIVTLDPTIKTIVEAPTTKLGTLTDTGFILIVETKTLPSQTNFTYRLNGENITRSCKPVETEFCKTGTW